MTVLSLTWESLYLGKTVFILRRSPESCTMPMVWWSKTECISSEVASLKVPKVNITALLCMQNGKVISWLCVTCYKNRQKGQHTDGLGQGCGISSTLAMEILQSCIKQGCFFYVCPQGQHHSSFCKLAAEVYLIDGALPLLTVKLTRSDNGKI